jgi:thymidylate synthase
MISRIDGEGTVVSPRGWKTKEILHAGFQLTNPRARLVLSRARRWSLPLALGELMWHLSASNEASVLTYYADQWRNFARGAAIPGSCYGFKLFKRSNDEPSQWDRALRELRHDPATRRAVVMLHDGEFETEDRDVACATMIQFLVRDDRLHATVYMRSNDVVWGLPYDCFLFTLLQELMAVELGLKLGIYTHFATSMHLYERHFGKVEKLLAAGHLPRLEMPQLQRPEQIPGVVRFEREIRTSEPRLEFHDVGPYWSDLLLVLSQFKARRMGNDDLARLISQRIASTPYGELLEPQRAY